MAEVVFMTGVADPLGLAGRLLRKKWREGARIALYAPPPLLQRLDHQLWAAEPLDFVPHWVQRAGSVLPPEPLRARTLLWLLSLPQPELGCESAVNLGVDGLDLAACHARIAEVVGTSPDERAAGRARWRAYEVAGHTLVHRPQG